MRGQSSHLSNGIRTHRYPLRDCHARAATKVLRANVRAPFQLGIASMAARFAAHSPNGFGGRSEPNSVVSTAMSLNALRKLRRQWPDAVLELLLSQNN